MSSPENERESYLLDEKETLAASRGSYHGDIHFCKTYLVLCDLLWNFICDYIFTQTKKKNEIHLNTTCTCCINTV